MDTREYKLILRFEDKRSFETVKREVSKAVGKRGHVYDMGRIVTAITRLYQVPELRMTILTHEVADSWESEDFSHLAWELAEIESCTDLALCAKFVTSANVFAETVQDEVPAPDDRTDEQVQADYMEMQNAPV